MHSKPAEISASALDALFGIELKTVAVEKWPSRQTHMRGDAQRAHDTQCGLDAMVKSAGDTTPHKCGMSEEKIQIAPVGVRSEPRNRAIRLGDDGMEPRQTLLPACSIGWYWRPRGKLLR